MFSVIFAFIKLVGIIAALVGAGYLIADNLRKESKTETKLKIVIEEKLKAEDIDIIKCILEENDFKVKKIVRLR